jgi:hypothetical protein
MDQIQYTGEPPKVILPNGGYLFTLVASEVPVTNLFVAEMLGLFSWNAIIKYSVGRGTLHFLPNTLQVATFIGEREIIFDALIKMLLNSLNAGATRFVVEVLESETNVFFDIKDNGDGIGELIEAGFMENHDLGMYLIVAQLEKIGAVLTYEGKAKLSGANSPGAKFRISFLKEVPKAA